MLGWLKRRQRPKPPCPGCEARTQENAWLRDEVRLMRDQVLGMAGQAYALSEELQRNDLKEPEVPPQTEEGVAGEEAELAQQRIDQNAQAELDDMVKKTGRPRKFFADVP